MNNKGNNSNNGKSLLEKTEHFIDKSIPYLIVLLLIILAVEIFFPKTAEQYLIWINLSDGFIIAAFVADLIFKYNRVRDIKYFVRTYWLDILAVFPFFLFLRLFEEVLLISERTAVTLRNLFHAGIVLEEEALVTSEAGKIVRGAEVLVKEGRLAYLGRFLRPIQRFPRLLKAFSYFEHPAQKKTLYHKNNTKNNKNQK